MFGISNHVIIVSFRFRDSFVSYSPAVSFSARTSPDSWPPVYSQLPACFPSPRSCTRSPVSPYVHVAAFSLDQDATLDRNSLSAVLHHPAVAIFAEVVVSRVHSFQFVSENRERR